MRASLVLALFLSASVAVLARPPSAGVKCVSRGGPVLWLEVCAASIHREHPPLSLSLPPAPPNMN